MDITKFNMTPGEVVKSIGERKLHPLSDYMLWAFYGKLIEWIKSDKVVLVCVDSSMTGRVAYHTLNIKDFADGSREEKVAKLPRPDNFRPKDTAIEFDFPDTVEVDKPEGKVVLKFDQLMMDFIERAGNLKDGSLKTINMFKVESVLFDNNVITLYVKVDDIGNEWFKFVLLSKEELEEYCTEHK